MNYTSQLAVILLCSAIGWGWTPFEVSPTTNRQERPSVSGEVVVWQEYIQFEGQWDWDIYGVDLANDPTGLIYVAYLDADQTRPSIWGTWVTWEDNFFGDLDVWVSDITDTENVLRYHVAITEDDYEDDQAFPRVHGNTVVWQHVYVDAETQASDWDIRAADITDPAAPLIYTVASFVGDQQRPDVYRSRVVWQDNYYGENDILMADVWRRNAPSTSVVSALEIEQTRPATDGKYVVWREQIDAATDLLFGADVSNPEHPVEFLISDAPGLKDNPAISAPLVVWQDNRSGVSNLYGYNLITGQEFAITDDGWNQTRPAIDGTLVAYEDDRYGNPAIFAVRLDGPLTADCPAPPAGDVNGDCRVDLTDLAVIAADWLSSALVY